MIATQTKSSQAVTLNQAIKHLAIFDFIMIVSYGAFIFYHWFEMDSSLSFVAGFALSVAFTFVLGICAMWIVRLEVDSIEDIAKSRSSDFTVFSVLLSLLMMLSVLWLSREFLTMLNASIRSESISYLLNGMINAAFFFKSAFRVVYVLIYRASENRTSVVKRVSENIHSHQLVDDQAKEVDADIYFQKSQALKNSAKTIMIDGKEKVLHPSRQMMEAYFKKQGDYVLPKSFSSFVADYYDAYMGEGILGKKGTNYYFV